MGLTLEEQERRAYLAGDTVLAAALAAAVDAQEEADEVEDLRARCADLEVENDILQDKLAAARRSLD